MISKEYIFNLLDGIIFEVYEEHIPSMGTTMSELGMDSLDYWVMDTKLQENFFDNGYEHDTIFGEVKVNGNTTFQQLVDGAFDFITKNKNGHEKENTQVQN